MTMTDHERALLHDALSVLCPDTAATGVFVGEFNSAQDASEALGRPEKCRHTGVKEVVYVGGSIIHRADGVSREAVLQCRDCGQRPVS